MVCGDSTGPPLILPDNNMPKVVAVDGSSAEVVFRITEDIPLVDDRDVSPNFTRYDGILSSSFTFTKTGSELRFSISSVDIYEDEGNYTVFASNPAGSSESTVYLDVQSQ